MYTIRFFVADPGRSVLNRLTCLAGIAGVICKPLFGSAAAGAGYIAGTLNFPEIQMYIKTYPPY